MNVREQQLREKDVRRDAPDVDPGLFLKMYLESNFPQTSSYPSPDQKAGLVPTSNPEDELKSNKKMALGGTQYDNPGGR